MSQAIPEVSDSTTASTQGGTKGRAPASAIRSTERARELGRLSGEARRAKAAERRSASSSAASSGIHDGQVGVVVPVDYVEVIRTLNKAAKGGDVQAARELRHWKAEHPEVDESVKLDQQPRILRDRLLRRLLQEEAALLAGGSAEEGHADPISTGECEDTTARGTGGEATPAKLGVPPVMTREAPQAHTSSENA